MVDQGLLINVVREQRLLWDKRHKHYRVRSLTKKAWKHVAEAVDCTSDEAQSKWKNLRDSFSRELKKNPKRRTEPETGNYRGDWHYFEAMQFLKGSIRPRRTTKARKLPAVTEDVDDETLISVLSDSTGISSNTDNKSHLQVETDSFPAQMAEEIKCEPYQPEPGPSNGLLSSDILQKYSSTGVPRSGNDYAKQSDVAEMFADLERQKINLMKKEIEFQEDEDMNWFKSILPHLKKLPSLNKFMLRTKVQEMLLNELISLNALQVEPVASQHASSTITSNTLQ